MHFSSPPFALHAQVTCIAFICSTCFWSLSAHWLYWRHSSDTFSVSPDGSYEITLKVAMSLLQHFLPLHST
jgi:hypothetical protein